MGSNHSTLIRLGELIRSNNSTFTALNCLKISWKQIIREPKCENAKLDAYQIRYCGKESFGNP